MIGRRAVDLRETRIERVRAGRIVDEVRVVRERIERAGRVDIARAALRAFFDESLLGQRRGGLQAVLRSYSEVRVQTSF